MVLWVISQTARSQWYCRILKLAISKEKIGKSTWFCCDHIFSWAWSKRLSANQISGLLNQLYLQSNRVNQSERWFQNFYLDVVKNTLCQWDCRILKSIIAHLKISESLSFLACKYGFNKLKRWFVIL